MEGEEIGLVLARASDLRSRISACVAAAGAREPPEGEGEGGEAVKRLCDGEEEEEEEEEEEVESLVGISNALESLERQLASLQVILISYLFLVFRSMCKYANPHFLVEIEACIEDCGLVILYCIITFHYIIYSE
jgi:hypothetical protein